MSKSTPTCPICGLPSRAKAACLDCRRAGRVELTCATCGKERRPGSHRRCAPCRYADAMASASTPCAGCGRVRALIAKGRCPSCYKKLTPGRWARSTSRRSHDLSCSWCSSAFTSTSKDAKYCSSECESHKFHSRSKELVRVGKPRVWSGVVVPGFGGYLTAGPCVECGAAFVGRGRSRYCSTACRMRAQWRRRYSKYGEFAVSAAFRLSIYERDGWVCQLCMQPVDPAVPTQDRWGATLDHIVPQSLSVMPDHSRENLRLSHRLCNSLRGDGTRELVLTA